jgi:prepilin-type N-terminal cleavage/methylation domain-containing protein
MKKLAARLKNLFKSSKGFTLIELLVVIGILGILAAALVATIDPFEQLKKAQDTNTTNALAEYINSVTRYYTTHTAFPWDATGANCNGGVPPSGSLLNSAGMVTCTTAIIGDNELKQAFSTSTSLQYIYITQDTVNNQTIGCFNPASKSILHNTNTKYDMFGVDNAAQCGSTALQDANRNSCFWCTR